MRRPDELLAYFTERLPSSDRRLTVRFTRTGGGVETNAALLFGEETLPQEP